MKSKVLINCKGCNKEILKWNYEIERSKKSGGNLFCSIKCCGEYKKLHPEEISDETREKLRQAALRGNKTRLLKSKPIEELKGPGNIRKRIFNKRGRKCEKCGWDQINPFTGIIPVQVDHIDGDRTNNKEENLQILCPNCHSMTEHFMFYGKSHKDSYGKKGTVRYR